jgi:hypothetical protein
MARDEDRNEHAAQPERRALFKGSDADIQEQEQPWESEESEGEPEQPEHIGIENPEADALEQTRSWSSEDELEHPYG